LASLQAELQIRLLLMTTREPLILSERRILISGISDSRLYYCNWMTAELKCIYSDQHSKFRNVIYNRYHWKLQNNATRYLYS
jgi:hypothetical protein